MHHAVLVYDTDGTNSYSRRPWPPSVMPHIHLGWQHVTCYRTAVCVKHGNHQLPVFLSLRGGGGGLDGPDGSVQFWHFMIYSRKLLFTFCFLLIVNRFVSAVILPSLAPDTPKLRAVRGSRAQGDDHGQFVLTVVWDAFSEAQWQGKAVRFIVNVTWSHDSDLFSTSTLPQSCIASANDTSCAITHDQVHRRFKVSVRAENDEFTSDLVEHHHWTVPVGRCGEKKMVAG